ncbi:hypothetical protein DFH05DRAFT_1406158 [Lentinula detonsa]|uniref:Zn(2)-C6 fungal-type domain-containing protein n=1 Tax=Lentinula detonsa TaxID=2804962 RepID=A0A9W8NSS1_9AGAR|nr:hypothetical protein DFH05DRAFT_1406158 [Lentinula detonsa]
MKRQRENSSSSSGGPSTSTSRPAKRAKSFQACSSCRKHKQRCEILDGIDQKVIRCHRCKVLEVDCSYSEMDRSIFQPARPVVKEEQRGEEPSGWQNNKSDSPSNPSPSAELFPNRPHLLWDFLDGSLDWTAPLQAIQELMKQTRTSPSASRNYHTPPPPDPTDSLDHALSPDQILHLRAMCVFFLDTSSQSPHYLSRFEQNYLPWLNFTPIRDVHSPLLDLVYCTIASRHLDDRTRAEVAPRLQFLTAENVARMILQSRRSETLESIQCLLILSLWAPVCGADEDFRDGRLLVASAVTMAHNMRLNEACQVAARLKSKREKGEEVLDHEMFDAMNKTRLWMALTNVESLLCTGSGRNPLSKRCKGYLTIFPASRFPVDIASGRDLRLKLLAELFDITEAGLSIRLQTLSESDVNHWYDRFVHVLSNLSRVARVLLPLPVVSDFETFYFQMLNILVHTCRLLILYQTFLSAREYFVRTGNDTNPRWFQEVRPHGLNILTTWGRETMAVAESILVQVLEMDFRLLGTSPDYVFNMIAFAASYVLGSKFLVLQTLGVELPGSSERLLSKCMERLHQCCYSPDSAARKCAVLISEMLTLWENKLASLCGDKSCSAARDREHSRLPYAPPLYDNSSRNNIQAHQAGTPNSNSSRHSSPQSSYIPETPHYPQQPRGHWGSMMNGDVNWHGPEDFKDAVLASNDFFDDGAAYGAMSNPVYHQLYV